MTNPTPRTPGTPAWIDFWCHDGDATASFFAHVLGWATDEPHPEFGGWRAARMAGHAVSGLGPALPQADGDLQCVYLACDDAKETLNIATGLGGGSAMPSDHQVITIGEAGTMATLVDCDGNLFSAWQGAHMPGFETTDAAGAPTWHELRTADPQATRDFYSKLFGLTWSDPVPSDGLEAQDYRIALLPDGSGVFGLSDIGGGQAGWLSYYWVEDLDTAHQRVLEADGGCDDEPHAFAFGRCADYRTPGGARFGLFQPTAEA